MRTSPLPRRLPIAPAPAHLETVASYLARLARLHDLGEDAVWHQASVPNPTEIRRRVDLQRLAALTGRPAAHLAGALPELRDPGPHWPAFRHAPQTGCPRCDARHLGGPVFRILPHHRYVCTRHQQWIGPPDINRPGPALHDFPDIVTAQRRHLRLLRRHGWATTYDAVLTGFMICGHLWEQTWEERLGPMFLRGLWDSRCYQLIPEGTETQTFSASRVFAAVYPEAVGLAAILASPFWRKTAAGGKRQLARFVEEIGDRIYDPYYLPRDNGDAIAHWIEEDCWRPPSPPPTTFPAAPGHRKPSQLARARRDGNAVIRHEKAIMWVTRKRRPGSVILHHRTVNPVLIREWSTPMEAFAGAIWQSQRTKKRFKTKTM